MTMPWRKACLRRWRPSSLIANRDNGFVRVQRRAEKFFAIWKVSIVHAECLQRWIISLQWLMNGDMQWSKDSIANPQINCPSN